MRHGISSLALAAALLVGCGQGSGNKAAPAASNSAAQNAAAPAAAPAAAANTAAPAAAAATATARPVRIGMGGELDLDACHTNGKLSGQDTIGILEAPNANARQIAGGEPNLAVHICETIPGWYGIVWSEGDPERDCGTGANLPGPKNYDGPCRSGWVPEQNVEVTAG